MQMFSYRRTMASAKRIVLDEPEQINPHYLKGRDRLIAISLEYQRKEAERKAAEEARKTLVRERVAREKALWSAKLDRARNIEVKSSPVEEIIGRVAAWHGLTSDDIFAHNRTDKFVLARRDAMAAVWQNCTIDGRRPSLPAMGRLFKRDHTSVLFALRKVGAYTASERKEP